ncbi:MAG: hypothetical protein HYX52_04165 [Chloroflexi bacterium]|nr:hypothetical protein [Chloroflexota bacterium]
MSTAALKDAWNLRLVGHSDLGANGDGMHVNVVDGFAYVGHMGHTTAGTSILDVRDPTKPRLMLQLPRPPGTHTHKVQVVDDVLLVNNERNLWGKEDATTWTAGLTVYDVTRRAEPRQIAFFDTPGTGVHRMTFWEQPYAYVTASDHGYLDQFLRILDLSNPARPHEVGRWWFPGQHAAGGETPTWEPITTVQLSQGQSPRPGQKRVALHHALPRGDRAYCGYWDAGLVILDIADRAHPSLVSHLDFGAEVSGATHTAFPVPGRDLLVVTDEQLVNVQAKREVRLVDIAEERRPRVVGLFPVPSGDFGPRFGPHNVHEMRPGSLVDPRTIYLTYCSGGLRVYDIADPSRPVEVAYAVPEAPPGQTAIHLNDLTVTPDGLIYVTDRFGGGLYVFERTR